MKIGSGHSPASASREHTQVQIPSPPPLRSLLCLHPSKPIPSMPNFPFHTRCAEENCRGEDHMCLYIFIKKQVTCHMKLRQTGKFKESAISIPSCLEQKITLKMQSVNFHHEPQGWRTKVSYNFLSCVPLRYSTCSPGREPIQVRF